MLSSDLLWPKLDGAGAAEDGVAPRTAMHPESVGKAMQCSRIASAQVLDLSSPGDVHRGSEQGFSPKELDVEKGQFPWLDGCSLPKVRHPASAC